jgi:nicotinate-nucleotide adenylyltransferase
MRIGVFGGSFNPVHIGHLIAAECCREQARLDRVVFVPAAIPPHKQDRRLASAEHRVAMVQAAIAHEPRFVLDRIEVDRSGDSFTLDTVRALAAAHPGTQWFLLIGQDQYTGLHTWRDWRTLLGLVVLAVANRPGDARTAHAEVQAFPHRMVPLPMLDISSTDIRRRVGAGRDISPLVPPGVARYIETHGLYQAALRS